MASNNLVSTVEVSDYTNIAAEVEADVAARQADGFNLVSAVPFHVVNQATGLPIWIIILSYRKP